MTVDDAKRASARAAVREVESGMLLGLGTGSTIAHFLDAVAERIAAGAVTDIRGVPTSERTAERCRELGIPLVALGEGTRPDLCVDGADEIGPGLGLIKGMGGALLREKMVAQASARFVVIADEGKLVQRFGTRSPLPVEVVDFGWESHLPAMRELGGRPELRRWKDGEPYRTDNGNRIVDLHFEGGFGEPERVHAALMGRAGVVETGLFLGMAAIAYLGSEDGSARTLNGQMATAGSER